MRVLWLYTMFIDIVLFSAELILTSYVYDIQHSNIIIHVRYSHSDRVAQVVERDASNIKVVSSILTAVTVFFTLPVETH